MLERESHFMNSALYKKAGAALVRTITTGS